MDSRRHFLGKVASGLGTLASVPARALGANDRIRFGIIGFGDRGTELFHLLKACPNTEAAAFADVYTKHLEKAPGAQYQDYRRLLDDKSIDAVIVATPQHLHAEHFCASLDAGKHVYQEKTMAFTVDHAKRMRAAHRGTAKVVQIGHQSCSFGQMNDVRAFLSQPERMGRITAINMRMYRNTPLAKPAWTRRAQITADVNPQNVAWESFLGEAPAREFDANRFIHWRLFEDYSGGNVHENMSHQLAFWYKALDLEIPKAVTMTGGVYLWKDGREVPDTMTVAIEQPENMLITWTSGFGNNQPGVSEDVLGTHGTIARDQQVRYLPQKVNRPTGNEITGRAGHPPQVHLQNFVDAIRGTAKPNCPFELGYRVSIASSMAVESFRLGRTVRWDAKKEEIV
ncbi:MAG: Gfo/Idh/MocA family oxidoreductase [Acidobacteriia bacterium]|nr:Gfo/Idh/MocA family oxidoreductase [Terriglobia bacterium]